MELVGDAGVYGNTDLVDDQVGAERSKAVR